jgi:hypothetical protein
VEEHRLTRSFVGVAAALFLAALGCSSDGTTTAPDNAACGTGGSVQLNPMQSATIDCSNGTTVTLQGGGASYLIVPQLATYGVPNRATQYMISAVGASATARTAGTPAAATQVAEQIAAARVASEISAMNGTPLPGARQRAFDAALRSFDRSTALRRASNVGPIALRSSNASASGTPQAPPLGSTRTFSVLSSNDPRFTSFKDVLARLVFAGDNVLLYTDTTGASNGFTAAQLNDFGRLFDQLLYTMTVKAFGALSDIDQNGRVLVLLTPVINSLSPAADCATVGYVAGFFLGYDISSKTSNSNQGEIFYGVVPDPAGKFSCVHTVNAVGDGLPSVFMHELQHMINYSQHNLVRCCTQEEGWLDEGLSLIAEELGSTYYEQKFPPPTGRSKPTQLFPDSAALFIFDDITFSYEYLLSPDTTSLTLHSDTEGGRAWRGGDWLLMRWLGDQQGEDIFRRLEQNAAVGVPNIESLTGKSFQALFGDFSLALYTDSIIGVPRSAVPLVNRFTTRTLRQIYQSLFIGSGPSADVPRAFPLLPRTLTSKATIASLMPGTMGFYRVDTGAGATATITFSTTSGGRLPSSLHPQLSIFRLPAGS